MTLAYTLLIGLASYRIWRLVAEDTITEGLRVRFLPGQVEGFIYCPWCLGTWLAFGVTWLTDATIGIKSPVLVGLASAVVVGWLAERL